MKGSSSGGCWIWNRRAVQLLDTLVNSLLWSTLIAWEKLGLNDRREQKVQLGHVAEKCDCVFFSQLAFLGYLLISCSAYCSVATQLTLSVLLLNMWELHLSTPSNACGAVAPTIWQTEMRWNWLVVNTIISWGHSAFQNNLNCTNVVNL